METVPHATRTLAGRSEADLWIGRPERSERGRRCVVQRTLRTGLLASLLGAFLLLGTRSYTIGAPGLTIRSKDATNGA